MHISRKAREILFGALSLITLPADRRAREREEEEQRERNIQF